MRCRCLRSLNRRRPSCRHKWCFRRSRSGARLRRRASPWAPPRPVSTRLVRDGRLRSTRFWDELEGMVDGLVLADLTLRKLDLGQRQVLVGYLAEDVSDHVEPHAALVLGMSHEPWRPAAVAGKKHVVTGARVVIPVPKRLDVHG